MRAGRLRHRVTIEEVTNTADGAGAITQTWSEVRKVWAAVEPARGAEFYASQTENSEVTGKIVMRYFSGLNPTMRINWASESRIFQIEAIIDPDERHRELQLMVKEVIEN